MIVWKKFHQKNKFGDDDAKKQEHDLLLFFDLEAKSLNS